MKNDWFSSLQSVRQKPTRLIAGVMSGTSVDAVDVAFCEITGTGVPTSNSSGAKVKLRALSSFPYPAALQARVRKSAGAALQEVSELHAELGELFGVAVKECSARVGIPLTSIDLIGSHGQTVYHHSGVANAIKSTLQLADGDRIAEVTGVPVVFDFRARDIAAGGEGAPLTPYADAVFFAASATSPRAVLNLGGIANITLLNTDLSKIIGFDTGPANAPIDRVVRRLTNDPRAVDLDGAMARSGVVNAALLQKLLTTDSYLSRTPPKSTGFEMYGDAFVERVIAEHGGCDINLLATVTEFVAASIADAITHFAPQLLTGGELILAGGGAKNRFLMERLQARLLNLTVVESDQRGVPAAAREAMAFALFANEFMNGTSSSLPSVTGAREGRVLGKLALP